MNCLLLRRCKQKNVPGIEKIAKIVNYINIIGFIELLALILAVLNIVAFNNVLINWWFLIPILVLAIDLVLISLKIHGIRKNKNGLLKAYIIYRYIIYIVAALAVFGFLICTTRIF